MEAGYLDEAVAPDAVIDRAVEVAAELADTLDPRAYAGTVKALRGNVLADMDAAIERDRAATAA